MAWEANIRENNKVLKASGLTELRAALSTGRKTTSKGCSKGSKGRRKNRQQYQKALPVMSTLMVVQVLSEIGHDLKMMVMPSLKMKHQNKSNNAGPTEVTEDVELQVDEDAEPTEVDARKSDALQRETEAAHEALERTQRQYEELKKQQEDSHRLLS
ncbi:hypothetical protein C2845_PM11G04340 [Panicum miliaceum]|uniref:Uncharacterized protein n=1 Tax=Panicum miliaceum TaxID=4540 RepID=A0A3L6RMR6_PANMI|nr:hypothetical protein C2845_PM11G04340 [Panicum miliaceum]